MVIKDLLEISLDDENVGESFSSATNKPTHISEEKQIFNFILNCSRYMKMSAKRKFWEMKILLTYQSPLSVLNEGCSVPLLTLKLEVNLKKNYL